MLHPDTELRFLNPVIGHGIVVTRFIPKGTITWVRDELDQTFPPEKLQRFTTLFRENLERYSFVDRRGDYVLCWDHARFVNHACEPAALSPGYGFELAVRDLRPGDELTDDYGTLNLDAPFVCRCGSPRCRKEIRPEDFVQFAGSWDGLIAAAFLQIPRVQQPLWELVREKEDVARALGGVSPIASCLEHRFGALPAADRAL